MVDSVARAPRPGPVSVFVADDHGELVAAATMDGAAPDTRLNAQRKAYTAARSDQTSTSALAAKVGDKPHGARELRSVLHLLQGRGGRVRRRAARRRDRRERPAGRGRRAARARGDRRSGPRDGMTAPRRARRRDDRRQGAGALAGRRGARARGGGVPALDAAARLGRAGSRGLVARDRGGARRARRRRRRRDRPLRPDARPRRPRLRRARAAARDPLERPAHRRRVRRDRGAGRRPRAGWSS